MKFGRPRKMTPHQRQEALQRLAAKRWLTSRGPTILIPPRSGGLRHRALPNTPGSACEKEEIGQPDRAAFIQRDPPKLKSAARIQHMVFLRGS
jgi:hypothetical protein